MMQGTSVQSVCSGKLRSYNQLTGPNTLQTTPGELPFFEENFIRRKMKSKNFVIFKVRLGNLG